MSGPPRSPRPGFSGTFPHFQSRSRAGAREVFVVRRTAASAWVLAPRPGPRDHGRRVTAYGPVCPRRPASTAPGVRPLARETSTTSPSSAFPSALRAGALSAVGTWTVVVLPALVGWVAAPETTVGWFSAVALACATRFVGHGHSVGA